MHQQSQEIYLKAWLLAFCNLWHIEHAVSVAPRWAAELLQRNKSVRGLVEKLVYSEQLLMLEVLYTAREMKQLSMSGYISWAMR